MFRSVLAQAYPFGVMINASTAYAYLDNGRYFSPTDEHANDLVEAVDAPFDVPTVAPQVGKWYRDREGHDWGPIEPCDDRLYPVQAWFHERRNRRMWTADGHCYAAPEHQPHPFDLVAEIPAPEPAEPQVGELPPEPDPAPLAPIQLQAGRSYRSRQGEIVTVQRWSGSRRELFTDGERCYRADGTHGAPVGVQSPTDLIELVEEPIVVRLTVREGRWYQRRDGQVVGPATTGTTMAQAGEQTYWPNGTHCGDCCSVGTNIDECPMDLVREVPAPDQPQLRGDPFTTNGATLTVGDQTVRVHGVTFNIGTPEPPPSPEPPPGPRKRRQFRF